VDLEFFVVPSLAINYLQRYNVVLACQAAKASDFSNAVKVFILLLIKIPLQDDIYSLEIILFFLIFEILMFFLQFHTLAS